MPCGVGVIAQPLCACTGVNTVGNVKVQGVLNLVDLAGSERVSRSGASGERLKETAAINKSLSCLTDVFSSLSKKNGHVRLEVVVKWRACVIAFSSS